MILCKISLDKDGRRKSEKVNIRPVRNIHHLPHATAMEEKFVHFSMKGISR